MTDSTKNSSPDSGCVIMASGLGMRFGGNKLMADFCGRPMVQHILDITEGLFKKRIVVTRNPEVKALCEEQNISVIFHSEPYRSDTIKLGLKEIREEVDGVMFCLADQPLLTQDTIKTILINTEKDTIVRPMSNGKFASPTWFASEFFDELMNLPDDMGGSFVAKKHKDRIKTVEINRPMEFIDTDTRELKDFFEGIVREIPDFIVSGKNHILITGRRGSGKTTLMRKLNADKLPGLTSWLEGQEAVYIKANGEEEKHVIGVFKEDTWNKEHRMHPEESGFTDFAAPYIDKLIDEDTPWISIDEIGYLESTCVKYQEAIERAMNTKHLIAVLRKQDLSFIEKIKNRDDVYLIDLT